MHRHFDCSNCNHCFGWQTCPTLPSHLPPLSCALHCPPLAIMHATLCTHIVRMRYACGWYLFALCRHPPQHQPTWPSSVVNPPTCVAKTLDPRHPRPMPCAADPWIPCLLFYAHISYACGARVRSTFLRFITTHHTTNHLDQVLVNPPTCVEKTLTPLPPLPCALHCPPPATLGAMLCAHDVRMRHACGWHLVSSYHHPTHRQLSLLF